MPDLYIIAGPNGAGKTTASMTILPEFLQVEEFVNADAIAVGLSPFKPDEVAIQAGKLMLERISLLLSEDKNFAFETTLSSKNYIRLIKSAQEKNYIVTLIYVWLESAEQAKKRVEFRVKNGGHSIPQDVIERRYKRSLENLTNHYLSLCNHWYLFDNSDFKNEMFAEGGINKATLIKNVDIWQKVQQYVI